MKFIGDYHTHTKYSKNNHGKNTIAEMVAHAESLGLSSYGVSDHGPKHALFGIKRKNIDKARREVEEINKTSKMKVYFGLEANLMSGDGKIDLTQEEINKLDYLIVGYHRGAINSFYCGLRAILNPEKQKQINTEAYLKCLNKYNISIISHLNEYIKVDVLKVATLAKEKGTIIELNNKHINFTEDEAKQLVDSGCKFILSSDAHKKENIARFDRVIDFIEKYNIPRDRIVNIAKEDK